MKKRIAIVGAGLCGSVLACLLRQKFSVTVIEQGRKKRPLFRDIFAPQGEINTSINRAEGLGGTTSYWHNALIELTRQDQWDAGINPNTFGGYYERAWSFFLSAEQRRECERIGNSNTAALVRRAWTNGHMVVPYNRANAWLLSNSRYPGDSIEIVYGIADKIVPAESRSPAYVQVKGKAGSRQVEADHIFVCCGGLSTPVLLARSLGMEECFCEGYHDHPMAYVAKVRLKPDSFLKSISCTSTAFADIRAGLVNEENAMKTVFFLRPAMNMGLKAITGAARYLLSDLRNDPFSPTKIFQLLTNLDALKEAFLFKSKAGFKGEYYSILMLGEQLPLASRGIMVIPGRLPMLNWQVTPQEHDAYQKSFNRFLTHFSQEITETNLISPAQWEYRTAAHHSGTARRFVGESESLDPPFFAAKGLPGCFVCDGSLLRAGGIANSGLTLVALSHRLADLALGFL